MPDIKLHPSWREPLQAEFDSAYMAELRAFLLKEMYPKYIRPAGR